VYGESAVIPTPEDAPFPIQTSLYGASKLAGEGMIQAYCEGFGLEGYIFRFVSILGERYSHGHVFDFCRQLLADSSRLTVLGNGHQRKSYLYVQDCIAAILCVLASEPARSAPHRVCTFNLGVDSFCEVRDSIGWITDTMGVSPELSFGTEARGWVGDNPLIHLDTKRIRALGWSPQLSIEQAVRKTTSWLLQNRWIFDQRQ
jgi:UDP-glucose 4-epimerase